MRLRLAVLFAALTAVPLHAQREMLVPSIESIVATTDQVVVGRLQHPGEHPGQPSILTVDETLKGRRSKTLTLDLTGALAIGKSGSGYLYSWSVAPAPEQDRLLVAVNDKIPSQPILIDLDDKSMSVWTEALSQNSSPEDILRLAREQARRTPAGSPHPATFAISAPANPAYFQVIVPADARLEARAHAILNHTEAGWRYQAVDALALFKSPANIGLLTTLLSDPEVTYGKRAEDNKGHSLTFYPVREQAWLTLSAWGLDLPEPIVREESYHPELITRYIISTKDFIRDADISALSDFTNLETLQLRNGKITAEALDRLTKFKHLRFLYLGNSNMSDNLIQHLVGLPVTFLGLEGTRVTDDAFATLEKMPALLKVATARTQITGYGIAAFHEKRPDVEVTR